MSHPTEIFGTQNTHDDDGQVIDSFLVEVDNPPDLRNAIEPIQVPAKVEPEPVTRLIGGYFTFPSSGGLPTLLIQPDRNRKSLHLRVQSAAATPTFADAVFIADELSKIQYVGGGATSATPIPSGVSLSLDYHTGALWAAPGSTLAGTISIMWTAVTI